MRKIIVIAVREYQAAVRTKAFLITLIAMPIMMGGGVVAAKLLEGKVDIRDKRIKVIDASGVLFDRLRDAAAKRNTSDIFDAGTGEQVKPRYLLNQIDLGGEAPTDRQLAEQCKQLGANKTFALVVAGADVQKVGPREHPDSGKTSYYTVGTLDIYSDANAFDEFRRWLSRTTNEIIQELRFAEAGLPRDKIDACLAHVPVASRKPLKLDTETGEVSGGMHKSREAAFLVPFGMMMLMFMVITIGAAPLINSVLEEKMQRIAEVLLGSVTPFQLMTGKLLGMVGVSATILALYLTGAVLGARNAGWGAYIPANLTVLVVWFVIFQALAVLLFGAMFSAIGAACSDLKEAQSMLMPVWVFIVFPMMVWFNVVKEPNSTFSLVLSLIPPATPLLMILRLAANPQLPVWQPIVGVVLVLAATVLCVFAAGRIFRVGLLIQGKGAKFSDMVRWAVRG